MRYALHEPLTLFFCEEIRENGEVKTRPIGEQQVFGYIKHAKSSLDVPLSSGGHVARAPVRKALREHFDIIIRTQRFNHTLEKIKWQGRWLVPLSPPQFLGARTGYSFIQTMLMETPAHG
jgi:hypothetical protein